MLGTLGHCRTRVAEEIRGYLDRRFDQELGTDTTGVIELCALRIDSENVPHGIWYEPIPSGILKNILARLEICYEEFTFVDFGSGKGRALLLAAGYPFKRIVGVEFAPQLHRVAENNLRIFQHSRRRCLDIESVCLDAIEFPIPDGPCVLFFYSPFKGPVMSKVLSNIKKSVDSNPRKVIIVYYGTRPDVISLLEKVEWDVEELALPHDYTRPVQKRALVLSKA